MPKTKSSKTATKTLEEKVADPAPVVVESAAPSVEKKVKAPKAPKVEAAPTPVPEPVVAGPSDAPANAEAPLAEQSVEFLAKLQQLSVMISTLKSEYRALEKKWSREVKSAEKVSSKRKRKAGNRAPSGFVKPTKISDELAAVKFVSSSEQ